MSETTPQAAHNPKRTGMFALNPGLNLLLFVVLMVAITALGLMIYDRLRRQSIMTVDVEWIMQDKLNQLQSNPAEFDRDQLMKRSQQWATQMAREVERLSDEYNAVVLTRPAVVSGSIDMTQHVLDKLNGGG